MFTINELCIAAANADLKTLQRLLEQEQLNPNQLHSVHQTRPIDFAAQAGHLKIVDYLYTKGAQLNAVQTNARFSLLYWICQCKDSTKRLTLLNWLVADDRYQQLNDGITLTHLDAATGKTFESTADLHGNFTPLYYAAIVENPHLTDELLLPHLNSVIQAGHNRGITLAWYLAFLGKLESLYALVRKWDFIDLNVAPLDENHPNRGITLAWLLAKSGKWELLETLFQKCVEPINLNAALLNENHPNRGITLAWLLAYGGKWELLETLFQKCVKPINLNAAPLEETHPNRDITLAWLLADSGKWELLETLFQKCVKPINLNAAPLNENQFSRGITLAWLLAYCGKWELLKDCIAKSVSWVDLNATPSGMELQGSLVQLLVKAKQWDLIKTLLKEYCECEPDTFHIRFEEIIDKHPNQQKLVELIQLVAIKYKYKLLTRMLNDNHLSTEDKKTEIVDLITEIHQLPENSKYYPMVQAIKGHLLLELTSYADLATWVVTTHIVSNEIDAATKMYSVTSTENQLKLLAIVALGNARESTLIAQLMAEIFAKSGALVKQLHTNSAPPLEAQSDAIKPLNTPILDDTNSTVFISSNTQENSSNYGFFENRLDTSNRMSGNNENTLPAPFCN